MIEYAIVLLTAIEDIHSAERICVQHGTKEINICGTMVREFVKATNHAYHDFPYSDCLTYGLELIPPEMRPIFEYLFETLRETLIWNEPTTFEES